MEKLKKEKCTSENMKDFMSFNEFCRGWINFLLDLNRKGLSKFEKAKIIGTEFEKYCNDNLLHPLENENRKLLPQVRIKGINYIWDFLLAKPKASEEFDIDPLDVIAAFEVKYRGIYSYASVEKLKEIFERVEKVDSRIRVFYITFRETNTYDRKDREIFGKHVQKYYRLSDSGDGVQLPPRAYFPSEWNRLTKNLLELI